MTTETFPGHIVDDSIWAIEPSAYAQIQALRASLPPPPQAWAPTPSAAPQERPYRVTADGVAVHRIEGTLAPRASWYGGEAVLGDISRSAMDAESDPAVVGHAFDWSTPGGAVLGIPECGAVLAGLKKPKASYTGDMCLSGGMWLASQTGDLTVGPVAYAGSVGAFCVIPDASVMFERMGVKMNVVRSAPGKGAGVLGTKITDQQLADAQVGIDAIHGQFVAALAAGFGISAKAASAMATGKSYVGQSAVDLGYAQRVGTLADVIARVSAQADAGCTCPDGDCPGMGSPQKCCANCKHKATAGKPAINRAETVARPTAKEETQTMSDINVTDAIAALTSKFEAAQAGVNTTLAATQAALATATDRLARVEAGEGLKALLAEGRAAKKVNDGNEPNVRTIAEKFGLVAATEMVAALPAIGPDAGTVQAPSGAVSVTTIVSRPANDFVSGSSRYAQDRMPVHQAALAFQATAKAAGRPITYDRAVIAVTAKG